MALSERKTFLPDPEPGMSVTEKNLFLSAKLAVGPFVSRNIFKIERIEIGGKGWMVHYRTGTP